MIHLNKYMSNIGKSMCCAITFALLLCTHAWAACGDGGRTGSCPTGQTCTAKSMGAMTTYSCVSTKICRGSVQAPCANKEQQCINTAPPDTQAQYSCGTACGGTVNGLCANAGLCVQGSNGYSCVASCGRKQNGACPNNNTCTNVAYMNQPNASASYACGAVCGGAVNGLCSNGDSCVKDTNNTYSCKTQCGSNYRNGYCSAGQKCVVTDNISVPGVGIRAVFQCQ